MAILKIKDKNGNFVSVPSIKGEKGDSGQSPKITVSEIENGYTLNIQNADDELIKINILNGKDATDEQLQNNINNYFEQNPIDAVPTKRKIAGLSLLNDISIDDLQTALNCTTKEYVDSAIGAIEIPEVDLTDYTTKEYVDNLFNSIENGNEVAF